MLFNRWKKGDGKEEGGKGRKKGTGGEGEPRKRRTRSRREVEGREEGEDSTEKGGLRRNADSVGSSQSSVC